MADGGLAICILITLAVAVFIVWARTSAGKATLRQTLGERQPGRKQTAQRPKSRTAGTSQPAKSKSDVREALKTTGGTARTAPQRTAKTSSGTSRKPPAKPRV